MGMSYNTSNSVILDIVSNKELLMDFGILTQVYTAENVFSLLSIYLSKDDKDSIVSPEEINHLYDKVCSMIHPAEMSAKAAILQLNIGDNNHYRRFLSIDRLKRLLNEKPDISNYELIYTKEIKKDSLSKGRYLCDHLYGELNSGIHPAEYYGYSPSVGDVIVLFDGDTDYQAYYIDDIGFTALPNFLSREMENKIKFSFDIKKEAFTLDNLSENLTGAALPLKLENRKEQLNDYAAIFEMAQKRKEIIKIRKTDPLFGEMEPFDVSDFNEKFHYFAIGKTSKTSEEYTIFSLTSKISIYAKGFETIEAAKDHIETLSEHYPHYLEHSPILVTKEDLKNILEYKNRTKHASLDDKLSDAKKFIRSKEEIKKNQVKQKENERGF